MRFEAPGVDAVAIPLGLRYSDFDVNEHVNNAAYLDLLQTALARAGRQPRPTRVQLHFAKAIPTDVEGVVVRIAASGATTRFSIEGEKVIFAEGDFEA